MIRAATGDDLPALRELVLAIGLFETHELDQLDRMMASHLAGDGDAGDRWLVVDDDGDLSGVAHYAPERMTQGTWNIYLLGVHPGRQGRGCGRSLLAHVESTLEGDGARLLIVETSGLDDFREVRAFYDRCGYSGLARIPGFYKPGDDKIVLWKGLGG